MIRQFRSRRWWLWSWCALLLALAQPSAAFAHASLISSDPVDEAVLATAPSSLTLTFNEAVAPLTMRIVDQHGTATEVTQIERRGTSLAVMSLAALAPGAYILSWRVASEDGHPVGGALTFWVGARGTSVPSVVGTDNAALRIAIWATRIVVYLGLFVGAGGAFFMAWMRMPPVWTGPRYAVATACLAGLCALVLSVGLQGLDALGASLSAVTQSVVWTAGARGSFGLSVALAAITLIAALLSLRWRKRLAQSLSLLALLCVGCSLAATGHAATAAPRALAVAAVALHGVSLAFWIGALMPLGFALGNRDAAIPTLMRFSRAIPFAVGALLASGLLLAILQVPHLADLWTSDYGRILIAKLALVAVLLAIALWNRVTLTPKIAAGFETPRRMRLSILGELLLVAVILAVVALWRFTPPPRLLVAKADEFFLHVHAEKAMANVTISPGSAGPVDIVVQLETPDERPLKAMAVSVTLAYPELGIETMTAQAQPLDNNQWRVQMNAPVPGRWTLGLGILISDFEKISIEAPILIK